MNFISEIYAFGKPRLLFFEADSEGMAREVLKRRYGENCEIMSLVEDTATKYGGRKHQVQKKLEVKEE